MEEKYKQNVEELKGLQLKMLENNERQLRLLRDMIDSEFSFQRIIDYEGSVILYDLQKDISDGLALSFSLKNMLKNRQSIEGIERISSLLDCFYNMTNDIYNKLDEYSLLK